MPWLVRVFVLSPRDPPAEARGRGSVAVKRQRVRLDRGAGEKVSPSKPGDRKVGGRLMSARVWPTLKDAYQLTLT
jgi:hypothetical protein